MGEESSLSDHLRARQGRGGENVTSDYKSEAVENWR